jgi:hypothetical protein
VEVATPDSSGFRAERLVTRQRRKRQASQSAGLRAYATSSWPMYHFEGITKVLAGYRGYAMPVILDFEMQAAVEGKSYPEIIRGFLSGTS